MRVFVTGGAGFVGSALVPALLARGHQVTVLDWYLYSRPNFGREAAELQGDIRDQMMLMYMAEHDAVIHLACVSNDPSFELNPSLGYEVNYNALSPLVFLAKQYGVKRFIYASSSSVYGVKPEGVEVTEDLALEPLTDYSKYKAMGEDVVLKAQSPDFTTTVLRPATVCGYAPRLRLDLVVNMFAAQAYFDKCVRVFGGRQMRPNIHISDMARAYIAVLEAPAEQVAGQVFNVGDENMRVRDIASMAAFASGWNDCSVTTTSSSDPRSYSINSDRIAKVLGFRTTRSVRDAIRDLIHAFQLGKPPGHWTDPVYHNLKQMQACHIS